MLFILVMAVTLLERSSLIKLFYKIKENAATALWKFRLLKNFRVFLHNLSGEWSLDSS